MPRKLLTAITAMSLSLGGNARAQGTSELRYDLPADLGVTLGGGTAWLASESLKSDLAPSTCHWCAVDGLDDSVRSALRWNDTRAADAASNVTAFVVAPVFAVGGAAIAAAHDGQASNIGVDSLLIVEATVLAMDLNQAVKFAAGRERPYVHALAPQAKEQTAQPSDNNLSFFSGHTTETFALVAAAGTVSTLRGYRWAPVLWAVGLPVAAATGYLRIAADKHYLTDALAGMLVGAAFGVGLPVLFHRPRSADPPALAPALALGPAPVGSNVVSLSGIW